MMYDVFCMITGLHHKTCDCGLYFCFYVVVVAAMYVTGVANEKEKGRGVEGPEAADTSSHTLNFRF